jgi:inorganic triphosphatase YgiF
MALETELKLLLPPEAAAGILRRPALRTLIEGGAARSTPPAEHALGRFPTRLPTEIPAAIAAPDGEPELEPEAALLQPGGGESAESEAAELNGAVQKRKLDSTYFDTPDLWLAAHGMALRVRKIGRKRIQTLKAPPAGRRGSGGLQTYREFEAEIIGERPVLAAIDDEKLRRQFEEERVWRRLRPVFQTKFQRSDFLVERSGASIELAVDHGLIQADGRRRPIAEIELELKSGAPAALFDLAEALALEIAEEHPVRLGAETKAARGFALSEGRDPAPTKATEIVLPGDISAEDAFTVIANNCLDQLRANEEAVLATEDGEAIHQFRVALRRLRAIVSAYRDLIDDDVHAMMSIDLRWLQRQCGPARDLDVLITETLEPIQNRVRGQSAFDFLIETAKVARAEARRAAHLAIENPRYVVMLIQLYRHLHTGDWRRASARARLGAPARDFATPLLQSRHKRLVKLGARYRSLPEPELHRVRILAKKMRYAAEAFRSLYRDKPVKKYTAALTDIQDRLGSLNDAFVSRQVLSTLAQRLVNDHDIAAADAMLVQGLVLGWQTARIDRDLEGFQDIWRDFAAQKRFWADR